MSSSCKKKKQSKKILTPHKIATRQGTNRQEHCSLRLRTFSKGRFLSLEKNTNLNLNSRNSAKVPRPKTVSDIQLHHGKTRQDLFSWMENISDPVRLYK